jgi:hypothetical protein
MIPETFKFFMDEHPKFPPASNAGKFQVMERRI